MKVHYNNPACIMIVFISKLRHYIKLIGIHSTKLFKGVIEHQSRLSSLSKLEKMWAKVKTYENESTTYLGSISNSFQISTRRDSC